MNNRLSDASLFELPATRLIPNSREIDGAVYDRISSVWPLMVVKCADLLASLRDSQRAAYDLEDLLSELWLRLYEQDWRFDSSRGEYRTHAGNVFRTFRRKVKEKAGIVISASNSGARLQRYMERRERGELSESEYRTCERMLNARSRSRGLESALETRGKDRPSHEAVIEKERQIKARRIIVSALGRLNRREQVVVLHSFGLLGCEELDAHQIAQKIASSRRRGHPVQVDRVHQIRKEALEKFVAFILDTNETL